MKKVLLFGLVLIALRMVSSGGPSQGPFPDGPFVEQDIEGDWAGLGYLTGTYRDGQREGPFEVFYPSGVLRGRGTYENDLREGPYESYHENGELRSRSNFVAGEPDGPFEDYYENGQLMEKGSWKDKSAHGTFEEYNENGQLMRETTYDRYSSAFESYHENGQLKEKGTFVAGELGPIFDTLTGWLGWDNVYAWLLRDFIARDEADGAYLLYDENGQLESQGIWKRGERCGEWIEEGEPVTYDPCPSN